MTKKKSKPVTAKDIQETMAQPKRKRTIISMAEHDRLMEEYGEECFSKGVNETSAAIKKLLLQVMQELVIFEEAPNLSNADSIRVLGEALKENKRITNQFFGELLKISPEAKQQDFRIDAVEMLALLKKRVANWQDTKNKLDRAEKQIKEMEETMSESRDDFHDVLEAYMANLRIVQHMQRAINIAISERKPS